MSKSDNADNVYFLYDRAYWGTMNIAWGEGLAALCPLDCDVAEWRESARRLARHLGCHVRTGVQRIQTAPDTKPEHRFIALANEGFPLGLVDPNERDAWLRQRAAEDG